ncbi:tRNA dihydrouridine synthase DusB [Ahrensia marina]|uniref:tRNA-dihydrouridine synthase n=1 Tax=Ahrensia marina TaxID=1514904 RepID=A0A0N0E7L1_9HYPH|nr:tRNA dihydrouridine synthase DusB [Ahrensia marina]KPB01325.1 tRNA-dihydrouridine synthase [Ahrensia marina]
MDDHLTAALHQPFQIGNISVRNRVLAAPLSGVSDLPFRQRSWAGGAGIVVSEMIASRELCYSSDESMRRSLSEEAGPVMLQLAGFEAHWMGEAAKMAEANGAEIIDINMGCPARKVTGKASGSALMRDLDHAMTLVDAAIAAVNVPVTLKMRLGWDDETINAPELARRAVDAGVQMITVHGRTRCQFYEGSADWDAVLAVRDEVDVPLVVNGDIVDLSSAEEARSKSGADAVMVGRAGQGAPWIVGDIARASAGLEPFTADPSFNAADYVIAHYDAMLSHYGERVGTRHARKHLGWYIDGLLPQTQIVAEQRQEIMRSHLPEKVIPLLRTLFENFRDNKAVAA